jgi:hypothetical protein
MTRRRSAIAVLQDLRNCYSEKFDGFSFTKFDGTPITIWAVSRTEDGALPDGDVRRNMTVLMAKAAAPSAAPVSSQLDGHEQ